MMPGGLYCPRLHDWKSHTESVSDCRNSVLDHIALLRDHGGENSGFHRGYPMPIVQITLIEGREEEAVKNCLKAVARAVSETLGAPLPSIRVVANVVPASHWAVGDRTKDEIALAPQETK
jgi:4-oxalocrotonate tautomerase